VDPIDLTEIDTCVSLLKFVQFIFCERLKDLIGGFGSPGKGFQSAIHSRTSFSCDGTGGELRGAGVVGETPEPAFDLIDP
jgi:hypothetical protein